VSENGIHFYSEMIIRQGIWFAKALFLSQHTNTVVPDLIVIDPTLLLISKRKCGRNLESFKVKYFPRLSDLEENWRSLLTAVKRDMVPQLKCTTNRRR
jgi:hypothetical protein